MNTPVKLLDILRAMDGSHEEMRWYVDRQTGQVVLITDEDKRYAENEDLDAAPQWQRESIQMARVIEADTRGRFVALPTQFDIHQWKILRDFADTAGRHTPVLQDVVHGKGAFRAFKSAVRRLGIEQQWYTFREKQYREKAIAWCRDNNVSFVDEPKGRDEKGIA
jgi:hypothetical protein